MSEAPGGFDPDRIEQAVRGFVAGLVTKVRLLAVLAALALVAFTSYYQIEPDEVGIVLRFGAYVGTAEPGPHFKLPLGIDRVRKVPVQRQLKQEFGFRTVAPDIRSSSTVDSASRRESLMLTGDLNVASLKWIVQFKIENPRRYLFHVRQVANTFRDMAEAVMREVVGDRGVNEVLTVGREEVQIAAKLKLQKLCDRYGTGIGVQQVVLKAVNPPDEVRDSFNEVNQAIQERQRLINQTEAEYNRVIPEARGRAKQAVRSAEGYAAERVNRAEGEAARFVALEEAYRQAPQVTRRRLVLEAMASTLPKARRRVLLDSSLKGILPLLSTGEK